MLSNLNLIEVVQEQISDGAEKEYGDKILQIPESVVRRFCAGSGTISGAGAGTAFMQYLAGLAGGPGALFVVLGGAGIGVLSGNLVNHFCKDILENSAIENTGWFSKQIARYVKPSKFCKKFLTASEEERNLLMRIGALAHRCRRFRPIDIIND